MKRLVTKILGVFMFVVFLAGIVPGEYIHDAFSDHEDAVHPVYKKGEIVITEKHHHCSFLNFEYAPFIATEQQFLTFTETVVLTGFLLPVYTYHHTSTPFEVRSPRGPPAFS